MFRQRYLALLAIAFLAGMNTPLAAQTQELDGGIAEFPKPWQKKWQRDWGNSAETLINMDDFKSPMKFKELLRRAGNTSEKIEEAYQQFCQIRDNLGSLSIAEIRDQFKPIAGQSKKVLDGLATKLNRRYPGHNKSELANQLRGILEDIKGTRMTEELIDSA